MLNTHMTPGKLVATGIIMSELHYDLYLYDWWIFSDKNMFYSISLRLGLKIILQLNRQLFIIHIVCHIHSSLQPGYICKGKEQCYTFLMSAAFFGYSKHVCILSVLSYNLRNSAKIVYMYLYINS